MTNEYNNSRRNIFNRLYKSAIRKKKQREQEEKDRIEKQAKEVREKAEHERKEAEEREKEAARLRREKREKLEKEVQQYIENLISLDFDFTDEESDDEETGPKSNGKPEENRKVEPADDEKRNGQPEDVENENGVPDKTDVFIEPTDEDETDLDKKKPLGGEASGANSSVSSYTTPSRTPHSSKHLSEKSTTKNPLPMLANMVQILSNPNIIVALEQFQGIGKEQDEVQLLSSPKVLAVLKDFHTEMQRGHFPTEEKPIVVQNEEEDMFSETILQNMKQEEKSSSRPAKRKLTEYGPHLSGRRS